VFAARRGAYSAPAALVEAPADAAALACALDERRNDLTEAAAALEPGVALALAALRARPGCLIARMSGSGATCFGMFATDSAAAAAAGAVAQARPDWWVAPTRLVADTAALAPD
jgi:4-diphosphocytidyl-2-C-methyl-D-erythritol kinase